MINLLNETENHYFLLRKILLEKTVKKRPNSIEKLREYLNSIEKFPVAERTLYVIILMKVLLKNEQELKRLLNDNVFTSATASSLKTLIEFLK